MQPCYCDRKSLFRDQWYNGAKHPFIDEGTVSEGEKGTPIEGHVEGTIKAVTGLMQAVPVYQDALQPAAQETGRALATVGRAVNAALVPIRGLVWGIEQIEQFVHAKVAKKLENVPVENIQTPDPAVAGPALESLRYTGHKESLSELYANLLASSMDAATARTAHPGFVEIIRNLSSDEARVISFISSSEQIQPIIDIRRVHRTEGGGITIHEVVSAIGHDAGCEHQELLSSYLVNLQRLGLIEMDKGRFLTSPTAYDRLLSDPPVKRTIEALDSLPDHKSEIVKYFAALTPLGRQFANACVISRN